MTGRVESQLGPQFQFAPGWFANVGLGYERGSTKTATGAESDSSRYQAGLAIKYQTGPWLFAGALSGGVAEFETLRTIGFPGFATAAARSEHDITFITGQLRAAYLANIGTWYAKPLVDVRLTHLDRDGLTETGGGTANLSVAGSSDTYFSVSPAVEIGTEYSASSDMKLKPFLKAGITYFADNSHSLMTSFLSAPAGIGSFTTTSQFDEVFADIEAGVAIFKTNGTSLSLGYKGLISDDTRQHGLYVKGTVKF